MYVGVKGEMSSNVPSFTTFEFLLRELLRVGLFFRNLTWQFRVSTYLQCKFCTKIGTCNFAKIAKFICTRTLLVRQTYVANKTNKYTTNSSRIQCISSRYYVFKKYNSY